MGGGESASRVKAAPSTNGPLVVSVLTVSGPSGPAPHRYDPFRPAMVDE
jgi:hypothetical protein